MACNRKPIDGEQRLHSLNFCQRALKGKSKVALLFDEVEDVLPGRPGGGLFGMMFGNKSDSKGGKAWINRALEENPVPTIWITNDANIETAYLRRFDYALALRITSLLRGQVMTGTPINSASQLVRPPVKGKGSSAMSLPVSITPRRIAWRPNCGMSR